MARIYALPGKGDGAMLLPLALQGGRAHRSHGRVYLKRIGNVLDVQLSAGPRG